MGGRQYYCDYCDKTFKDELKARKRHLKSNFHQRLLLEHYSQFRDLETILYEEVVKQPCKRFFTTGMCVFQAGCKYTHFPPECLYQIKQYLDYDKYLKYEEKNKPIVVPDTDPYIEKINHTHPLSKKKRKYTITWVYPSLNVKQSDLPPSLRKFVKHEFRDADFATWGD